MSINEVRYLPECGSTNAYMKEHFEEFGPVGAVYTTNQTAGRGRLGRTWVNAEGKALYYTVAIREPLAQPATLPLLASLAVRRQLALRYGVGCQLKWPNDLVARGRKLGGILVEAARDNEGKPFTVCGIGVNVNYTPQEVPDGGLAAIGLSDLNESVPAVDMLLDEVYHAVIDAVDTWAERLNAMEENAGPLAPVHDEYVAHLNWIGEHVIARSPAGDELARGIFRTVDDCGRASIETESGLCVFHFEEASLRPLSE